jgi:hypothetical protein
MMNAPMTPAICVDVEIFPNFTLIGVLDLITGRTHTFSTEPGIGETFDLFRQWYTQHSDCVWVGGSTRSNTTISF